MNEQECLEIYNELKNLLYENSLEWVIEQVEETFRAGKIVEYSTAKSREINKINKNSRSKELRMMRENYSVKEQLLILIDAIENIAVNPLDIKTEINNFINEEKEMNNIEDEEDIKFLSVEEEQDPRIFYFEDADFLASEANELRTFLQNLRNEVIA
jgi:archaellum biogenesis ATPase FlaH